MSLGAGTKRRSPMPAWIRISHSTRRPIGDSRYISRSRRTDGRVLMRVRSYRSFGARESPAAALANAGSCALLLAPGAHDLAFQLPPDPELQGAELGRGAELHQLARVRKRHRHHLFDAARLRRHDHRPVAEEHPLLDLRVDISPGLAVLLPPHHH